MEVKYSNLLLTLTQSITCKPGDSFFSLQRLFDLLTEVLRKKGFNRKLQLARDGETLLIRKVVGQGLKPDLLPIKGRRDTIEKLAKFLEEQGFSQIADLYPNINQFKISGSCLYLPFKVEVSFSKDEKEEVNNASSLHDLRELLKTASFFREIVLGLGSEGITHYTVYILRGKVKYTDNDYGKTYELPFKELFNWCKENRLISEKQALIELKEALTNVNL